MTSTETRRRCNDALIALNDRDGATADRLADVVNGLGNIEGYSRSVAARKAGTDLATASRLLDLLAGAGQVEWAGNGAWRRFHARSVSA